MDMHNTGAQHYWLQSKEDDSRRHFEKLIISGQGRRGS